MPSPGVVNNPSGVNSFDHFAPEPAYGEATQQSRLAAGAPLAGAPIASGPINAPQTAQRDAAQPQPAQVAAQPLTAAPAPDAWAQIASLPGITPLAFDYAQRTA